MNTGFNISSKTINYIDRNISHNDAENSKQRSMTIFEDKNGINLSFNVLNKGVEIVGVGRYDEYPFYHTLSNLVSILDKKSEQTTPSFKAL